MSTYSHVIWSIEKGVEISSAVASGALKRGTGQDIV